MSTVIVSDMKATAAGTIDRKTTDPRGSGFMALVKRSLTLHGHRTSLALEREFWVALEAMARSENISLPALVARIDDDRHVDPATTPPALSSALRVAALAYYRQQR